MISCGQNNKQVSCPAALASFNLTPVGLIHYGSWLDSVSSQVLGTVDSRGTCIDVVRLRSDVDGFPGSALDWDCWDPFERGNFAKWSPLGATPAAQIIAFSEQIVAQNTLQVSITVSLIIRYRT